MMISPFQVVFRLGGGMGIQCVMPSFVSFFSIHPEQRMLLWWCIEKLEGGTNVPPFLGSNGLRNLGKPVLSGGQTEVCRYAVVEGRVLGETHVNEPEVVAVLHDVQ